MDQETLKQLLKNMIDETEKNNLTTIKDMIQVLAVEMRKVS